MSFVPAEMSNHFPATIYSIINTLANFAGMTAPLIIGVILGEATGAELKYRWDDVFYMVAIVVAVCTTSFMFFGSAEIQSFDYVHKNGNSMKRLNSETIRRRSRQYSMSM